MNTIKDISGNRYGKLTVLKKNYCEKKDIKLHYITFEEDIYERLDTIIQETYGNTVPSSDEEKV